MSGTQRRRQQLWQILVDGSIPELGRESDFGAEKVSHADLLANLFEKVSEEAPEALTDFLRRPTATLAIDVLCYPGTLPNDEAAAARQAGAILQMWTHALVGALHRISPAVSDKPFGGVVKFIRAIQTTLDERVENSRWPAHPNFLVAVERCVRSARKWGIDGWTYRDRTDDLQALTDLLQKQANAGHQSFDSRSLDVLAYGARLLEQRYDIEAHAKESEPSEDAAQDGEPQDGEPRKPEWAETRPATRVPGVTAWDIQIDDHHLDPSAHPNSLFVAVAWSHGIEVYRLSRQNEPSEPTHSGWSLDRVFPEERDFPDSPERYSRGITISRSHDDSARPLLILARRADPNDPDPEPERVEIVGLHDRPEPRGGLQSRRDGQKRANRDIAQRRGT